MDLKKLLQSQAMKVVQDPRVLKLMHFGLRENDSSRSGDAGGGLDARDRVHTKQYQGRMKRRSASRIAEKKRFLLPASGAF